MKPSPNVSSTSTPEPKIILDAIILTADKDPAGQVNGPMPVAVPVPGFHARQLAPSPLPLPSVQTLLALAPATAPGLHVRPASGSPHPLPANRLLAIPAFPLPAYSAPVPSTSNYPASLPPIRSSMVPSFCYASKNTLPPLVSTPVADDERPAKRRRIAEPLASPASSANLHELHSSSVLINPSKEYVPPPPIKRPLIKSPAPVGATEIYSVEGMKDADLARGAELLELDSFVGLNFLKQVCRKNSQHFAFDQDRLDFVKKVVSCLSSVGEKIQRAGQEFPEELRVKLINGLVRFLQKSDRTMQVSGSPLACEAQKLLIGFFNENHSVLNLIKKHVHFAHRDELRFAGGKTKFEFLCWCAGKDLRLDDRQLAEFISAEFLGSRTIPRKICEKIGLEVVEEEKSKSS